MLYFTATPIGNLEDITYRAIRIMKESDYIICENISRTGIILKKYEIKKPLKSYNDYNKIMRTEWIIKQLKEGFEITFVTSAGSPLISDPGFYLIKRLMLENLPFTSIPGPSAVINSLILSGIPPDRFIFEGYLPRKKNKRHSIIQELTHEKRTVIVFESPKRIKRLIKELDQFLPDREVSIIKEMTKIHQTVIRGKPKDLLEKFPREKGEFVVIIGGEDWIGIH